jgi:hypothetical protein
MKLSTVEKLFHKMAIMTDGEFEEWAENIGYTRKPNPNMESMSNFRMRVVDSLVRSYEFVFSTL